MKVITETDFASGLTLNYKIISDLNFVNFPFALRKSGMEPRSLNSFYDDGVFMHVELGALQMLRRLL